MVYKCNNIFVTKRWVRKLFCYLIQRDLETYQIQLGTHHRAEKFRKTLSIFSKATNPNKVIRVVEFSSGGYKIWKIFAYESTYPKEIIAILRIGVVVRCQKLGIILVIKSFKNWCYQKMSKRKNVLLNWYSSMKKFEKD